MNIHKLKKYKDATKVPSVATLLAIGLSGCGGNDVASSVIRGTVLPPEVSPAIFTTDTVPVYGVFTLDETTGAWEYVVDESLDAFIELPADGVGSEDIVVTITDGNGVVTTANVNIPVTGFNDTPVITSAAQTGAVTEDDAAANTATGTITSTDVDADDTAAYSGDATGTYGAFVVDAATGAWTYTLDDSSVQDLDAGDTVSETFTVTVTDGNLVASLYFLSL